MVQVLSHLRQINMFVEVYGTDDLDSNYEFVEMIAVIQVRKTGHIGLAIINFDLESYGEHWRTYFLTPRGVVEQHQDNIFKDDYNYVMEIYLPYDYWYTVSVEGDIHVDFDNVLEKINGMLNACHPDHLGMKME